MNKQRWQVLFFGLLISFFAPASIASIGKVIIAKGETYAIDAASNTRPLSRRSDILEGDTLITGADSEIHIRFEDNAVLALRADSKLKINEYHANSGAEPEQVLMELLSGGFRTISGTFGKSDRDAYQIRTPNASIGIRGTNYEAVLSGSTLLVGVYQGGVRLQNDFGSINLGLDSPFSFAQVNSPKTSFQGLMEAPKELSSPLTTSFNAAPTENSEAAQEDTANLQNDDEELLVENLFSEDQIPPRPSLQSQSQPTQTELTGVNPPVSVTQVIDKIVATTNLDELQDLRLSQEQIRLLKAGADVGFVVINQDPTGFRLANYQMSFAFSNISTLSSGVSFKINHAGQTYEINLTPGFNASSSLAIANEINNQISAQVGLIDQLEIPSLVTVDGSTGTLLFKGFGDQANNSIVFDNFTGTASEPALVAAAMGLCDNATIACSGSYDLGALSAGNYDSAIHFGYMVPGKNGPVFANYNNESITALLDGYKTPDNVLRGNANATVTEFTAVDTNIDSVSGSNGGNSNIVKWGYWDTNTTNPALLLKDAKTLAASEAIAAPFFYVVAPPAKAADLVGEKTMSTVVDWHGTSSTTTGMQNYVDNVSCVDSSATCLTASLAVNFANAEATGTVDFGNSLESWNWSLEYYGKVKGAQFVSEYGYGTLYADSSTYDAAGHIDGMFTDASSGLGFIGGFGMQTTDDTHNTQGAFIIK